MATHPYTVMVTQYYDELSERKDFSDETSRINTEDLPPRIQDLIQQLSPRTRERYIGSGIIIPEHLHGATVLDIGCGAGGLVFLLSKLVGPQGHVIGIDTSNGMIQNCKSEIEYHRKQWGFEKANTEFHVLNAERLLELGRNKFDAVVSTGVFCLLPDQAKVYSNVAELLKPGGQFYLQDVYTDREQLHGHTDNKELFAQGSTGCMMWSELANVATKAGLTTPSLTQAYPVGISDKETHTRLKLAKKVCAAHRMFKLPQGAHRGAATVTYRGNIEEHEDAFTWDVSLTFKSGEPVNVDAELATILAYTSFQSNFVFDDFHGSVTSNRNQDPFQRMEELETQGKPPAPIYTV